MRQTVNRDEISRFSAHAEDWWNQDGKFKPLHRMNPLRLGYITETLCGRFNNIKGLEILDVGCGGGLLCEPMARLGAKVTGIDADATAIAVAKSHAAGQNLKVDYRNIVLEKVKEKFDVILALEIIEHVEDTDFFIQSLAKNLKSNGVVILSTLNRTTKSYLQAIVLAENVLGWIPQGTHDWHKFIMPQELEEKLATTGLKAQNFRGMKFNPIGQRWFLNDDLSVNYILSAVKGD